jgi:predicted ABC-type ATPase
VPQTTPRKPDKPILWIVAGPNGSGKSSLYNRSDIEGWGGSVWIINPDLLTVKIVEQEKLDLEAANLEAVQRIEAWLNASVDAYQTIGVETVLSSPKYQPLVVKAKAAGFAVRMIYVVLRSADLQIERVAIRVSDGGHDVPHEKILFRRTRSFEQLAWFLDYVDNCYIYDNSDGTPDLLAELNGPALCCWKPLPTDMEAVLKACGTFIYKYKEVGDDRRFK